MPTPQAYQCAMWLLECIKSSKQGACMNAFIFNVIPADIILHIFNDWLFCLRDFISLDGALINKDLRKDFFFTLISFQTSKTGCIWFGEVIKIRSLKKVGNMLNWEKSRGLRIARHLEMSNVPGVKFSYSSPGQTLCSLGLGYFDCNLLDIFAGFPCLESLSLDTCHIFLTTKDLDERISVSTTRITRLSLSGLSFCLVGFGFRFGEAECVAHECGKIFPKIAQYCPKLQHLTLKGCYKDYPTYIIRMLRSLPELTDVEYERRTDIPQSSLVGFPLVDPHSKIRSFISRYFYVSSDSVKVLVACSGPHLRHVDLLIPSGYVHHYNCRHQPTLFHCMEHLWTNVQSLTLSQCALLYLPLCLRVCQQLQSLTVESRFSAYPCFDWEFAILAIPNCLPSLRTISFKECNIANEAIATLCASSVAPQLTSFAISFFTFNLTSYQLILKSFPHLEHLHLSVVVRIPGIVSPSIREEYLEKLSVKLFDADSCVFTKTIQTLSFKVAFCDDDHNSFYHPIEVFSYEVVVGSYRDPRWVQEENVSWRPLRYYQ